VQARPGRARALATALTLRGLLGLVAPEGSSGLINCLGFSFASAQRSHPAARPRRPDGA